RWLQVHSPLPVIQHWDHLRALNSPRYQYKQLLTVAATTEADEKKDDESTTIISITIIETTPTIPTTTTTTTKAVPGMTLAKVPDKEV
ncbi:unnamed protein product, partial [Allacma fusca]